MTKALLHELGKSLSFGRLSLKAKVLWPMLLASSDDQGRGLAEYDAIKWYVCPNVPEINIDDVAPLLGEMEQQGMITVYGTDRGLVYQVVRWWEYQELQWARPSKYDAPADWTDRVRYSNRGDYFTDNWDTTGGFQAEPKVKSKAKPQQEQPPSEPPRKLPGVPTQPNLTELNLTDKKDAPVGAVSPEQEAQNDIEVFFNGAVPETREPEAPAAPEKKDAVVHIVKQAARRDNGDVGWLLPGTYCGNHDYLEPFKTFCEVINRRPKSVGEKMTRSWLKQLEATATEQSITTPAIMAAAIKEMRDEWGFSSKAWKTPYSQGFVDLVGTVADQVEAGDNGGNGQKPTEALAKAGYDGEAIAEWLQKRATK